MRIPFTLKRSAPSSSSSPSNTTSNEYSNEDSNVSPNKKSKAASAAPASSVEPATVAGLTKCHAIELNGQLVVPKGRKSEGIETELGLFTMEEGTPTLLVGTHEIKGKIVKLKKPLLLVRKKKSSDDKPLPVEAEGIITEKYLFNGYPKTIMREKH
ncbi:hypothetical protein TrST_g3351 [Triparma strigata]|uniref:Chromosome transmission fidelity protein 8 n=1 Tax=Triparma strigata TaxID=1606541 RepID=A0A9W7B8Z7_9STRA|nr:hypothetical protein TrST_g3351 [Triparma strigata]